MKKITLLLLFAFFVANAQYKITPYTTLNSNLPHDLCYGIEQDSKGYIWLGTDDGLARFNGNNFKKYTIQQGLFSNFVIDVINYNKDTLATVTWGGGLQLFNSESFVNFGEKLKLSKVKKFKDGLFVKGNYYIHFDKNFNYTEKAFYINKDNLYVVNKKNLDLKFCYPNFEVIDGKIYFFNDFIESNSFDGTKYFKGIYTLKNGKLQSVFPFLNAICIETFGVLNEEIFYVTTRNKIIFFNNKQILKTESISLDNYVIKKSYSKNNRLILVLFNLNAKLDALYFLDLNTKEKHFFDSEVIDRKLVSDILIDNHNFVWVSTYGAGLFKIANEDRFVSNRKFISENIIDITEDDDKLYFITSHKLFTLHKKTKTIDTLFFEEELWKFGTNNTSKINVYTRKKYTDELDEKLENNIVVSSQKQDFVEREGVKISYLEYDLIINFQNRIKKYKLKEKIRKVLIQDKMVFLATVNGLYIYDINSCQFKVILNTKGEKANNDVKDIVFFDNKLWLASNEGLFSFEKDIIINHTKNNELAGASINSFCLDHHGVIWLATQKGFSVFKNNQLYNFYYKEEGVSTFTLRVHEDNEHNIWIIGNKGAFKIDNKKVFFPNEKPILNIEHKGLVFDVDVISFLDGYVISEFKLNNEDWQEITSNQLNFSNYKNGKYTLQFRTKLLNSDWNYSNKYNFKIVPPWYKQTWSYVLLVFLSGLIVTSIVYIRYKRTQKRNFYLTEVITKNDLLQRELTQVRSNVAQDFHDELGNKLAGITMLSNLMKENESDKDSKQYRQISRINKDAQDLYFGIKDFIWSIDSKNDEVHELIYYLKDFGEELFAFSTIAFEVTNKLRPEEFKLPYYWARQILLLFKEAMTNTLKYSQASECVLQFELEDLCLIITLIDNGIGFKKNELHRINGLNNMQNRADRIDATLEIESKKGTKIVLICKLQNNFYSK